MVKDLLDTKEIAKYLNINEKQVYQLANKGKIPATRITGKWLFPKRLIDDWIETKARDNLASRPSPATLQDFLVVLGSNDLSLDYLLVSLRDRFPESTIVSGNVGSMAGLQALKKGKAHLSAIHLLDPGTGQYNLPYLKEERLVLVNLVYRDQGIMVSPGNSLKIRGLQDLVQKKARFINRQIGSGTRLLLDTLLKDLNINSARLAGYKNEVTTHLEVGIEIMRGNADAGLGVFAVARYLGLDFIPLTKERFDLLIPEESFFVPQIQSLLSLLHSKEFREKVMGLGGYDTTDSGKIIQRG